MTLIWHFIEKDGTRGTTKSIESLPKHLDMLGVGYSEGDIFALAYFDSDVVPVAHQTDNEALIGWMRLGRTVAFHIPLDGSTRWLSTGALHLPRREQFSPPITLWRPHYKHSTKSDLSSYTEIDRSNLYAFSMTDYSGKDAFTVLLEPHQRLIWRRRVFTTVGGKRQVFYLCGFQETAQGQNHQAICYVPESGAPFMLTGRFRKDHPLFYAVNLHPEELS